MDAPADLVARAQEYVDEALQRLTARRDRIIGCGVPDHEIDEVLAALRDPSAVDALVAEMLHRREHGNPKESHR